MDKKAKEESRKAANKRFHDKQKSQTTYCEDCNKHIKTPTYRTHILTKKHLQNTLKERKTFFEEYLALHEKLTIEGQDVRKIFMDIKDLIEGEYCDEDGNEILPEEERYTDPLPFARNDVERDFCGTIGYMERQMETLIKKLNKTLPPYLSIDYLEAKEKAYNNIRANIDDRDLKKKILFCFQDFMLPFPPNKEDNERHKKIQKWNGTTKQATIIQEAKIEEASSGDDDDDEEEEEEEKAMDVEEEEEDTGVDTYDADEENSTTAHFPTITDFRNLKKIKKEMVLEEIASNCAHVFEDERFLIDMIFEVLSEKESLKYDILYDDIISCYRRWKYNCDMSQIEEEEEVFVFKMYGGDDSSVGSNSTDMDLNHDFKYEL